MTDPITAKAALPDDPPAAKPTPPQDRTVSAEHQLVVDGQTLDYTATCGTVVLREEELKDGTRLGDKPRASVFFIAYTRHGSQRPEQRPITFAFNGGPGSSSVWLHLGILGPQRVAADEFGRPPPPPYALVDNEHTLLTHSDLVFIDPVGTGHSRMADGEKSAEFHEYQRDLDAVGEFIRQHLTRAGRWGSPKYLIGESYGTTRAAGLAAHLQTQHSLFLNGLMLVSMAVDMQTLRHDHGNDLPYPLFLPTYAATAWFHGELAAHLQAQPLQSVIAAAESFASTEYSVALLKGSRLDAGERERVSAEVARFSGVSAEWVLQSDLRPQPGRYFKQLLRDDGLTIGRLDSRFTGHDRDDSGAEPESDAAMNAIVGAYAAGIHRVLKETLKYDSDLPYKVHAPLWQSWGWKDYANQYANIGNSLRRAMQANPALRVYVASGYYDLATPHSARLHARAPGAAPAPAAERHGQLLRGRAHDVHPRAVAGADGRGTAGVRVGGVAGCRALNVDFVHQDAALSDWRSRWTSRKRYRALSTRMIPRKRCRSDRRRQRLMSSAVAVDSNLLLLFVVGSASRGAQHPE